MKEKYLKKRFAEYPKELRDKIEKAKEIPCTMGEHKFIRGSMGIRCIYCNLYLN